MMKRILPAMLTLCLLLTCCPAPAEETPAFDGTLKMENGTLLPMLNMNDPRDPDYTNEGSDILRYCVYVETDNDTDNDGLDGPDQPGLRAGFQRIRRDRPPRSRGVL